jgi:hypothetical protein
MLLSFLFVHQNLDKKLERYSLESLCSLAKTLQLISPGGQFKEI